MLKLQPRLLQTKLDVHCVVASIVKMIMQIKCSASLDLPSHAGNLENLKKNPARLAPQTGVLPKCVSNVHVVSILFST